ncbi:hypothetical protein BURK2_04274 [Burkholderiales bacterium]|nr:hypothetical protein BURK2_04274 [Burkholderiales bacterium]
MNPALNIHPLTLNHLDALGPVFGRPEVFEHFGGEVPTIESFRRHLTGALPDPGPQASAQCGGNCLVRLGNTGEVLGCIEATVHGDLAQAAFPFGELHWGHGHASLGLD